MKSIAHPAPAAPAENAACAHGRNLALDRARTFLTVVVVIHHAVIPYTYFGHTDPKSWLGFDMVVLATDSFFMAMFFFLSGLFVWPSLARRVPGVFARDRLLRLGLPFVIAALTVIPIAYYALALREQPDLRFGAFWWNMVTEGPWPSGPVWFVWVLLLFDLAAGALYRISANSLFWINRLSVQGFKSPALFFIVLVLVTGIAYVPMRLIFGPSHWFEWGPFSVQASRVLLYALYFFIGAGIGAGRFSEGVLASEGRLANSSWVGWGIVTLLPYSGLWGLIYVKREILDNPDTLPMWYEASYGVLFVVFSAGMMFTILAFFMRWKRSGWSILDPMQNDAYGIFLVHYAFVLWIQYWMLDLGWPAIVKALVAFIVTMAASWIATRVLRQIPGSQHVL